MFWNIRGLVNHPSRLALKRLFLLHKPDILLIAEPLTHFQNLPPNWLQRLGLKIFSFNERLNLLPNLWCIFSIDISPNVIDIDDQQVTFSLSVNNISIFISAIYASTSNINRKNLWLKLNSLQNTYDVP